MNKFYLLFLTLKKFYITSIASREIVIQLIALFKETIKALKPESIAKYINGFAKKDTWHDGYMAAQYAIKQGDDLSVMLQCGLNSIKGTNWIDGWLIACKDELSFRQDAPGNSFKLFWTDPDDGICSRYYTISKIRVKGDIVCITDIDGTYLECCADKLSIK